MSQNEEKLFEKWISAKFDAKIVISATKKEPYVNVSLSAINGKEYKTKLGNAMSLQLGANDINEMIAALTEIKEKHLPQPSPPLRACTRA